MERRLLTLCPVSPSRAKAKSQGQDRLSSTRDLSSSRTLGAIRNMKRLLLLLLVVMMVGWLMATQRIQIQTRPDEAFRSLEARHGFSTRTHHEANHEAHQEVQRALAQARREVQEALRQAGHEVREALHEARQEVHDALVEAREELS